MSRMRSGHGGRRLRRQFSDEYKEGAVRLVLDEGKTVGAVARELDLMVILTEHVIVQSVSCGYITALIQAT